MRPVCSAGETRIQGLERGGERGGEEAGQAEAGIFGERGELVTRFRVGFLFEVAFVGVEDRLYESWPARGGYVGEFQGIVCEGATDAVKSGDEVLVEWFERAIVHSGFN